MSTHKDKKIFIIDDEPDLREMLQYQLESAGFKIYTAENGVDALNQLKKLKPDLIILDLNMPEMGGKEFYKKITEKGTAPVCPILALTADVNFTGLFEDFNVDAYIAKPFTIEELMRTINTTLDNAANNQ